MVLGIQMSLCPLRHSLISFAFPISLFAPIVGCCTTTHSHTQVGESRKMGRFIFQTFQTSPSPAPGRWGLFSSLRDPVAAEGCSMGGETTVKSSQLGAVMVWSFAHPNHAATFYRNLCWPSLTGYNLVILKTLFQASSAGHSVWSPQRPQWLSSLCIKGSFPLCRPPGS